MQLLRACVLQLMVVLFATACPPSEGRRQLMQQLPGATDASNNTSLAPDTAAAPTSTPLPIEPGANATAPSEPPPAVTPILTPTPINTSALGADTGDAGTAGNAGAPATTTANNTGNTSANGNISASAGNISSGTPALEATAASSFPGYPASAGLLAPELAPLLQAIQDQHLYEDSKTAVDLVLLAPAAEVAASFSQLQAGGANVSRDQLQQLVNATSGPAGSDLEVCNASDWQPQPPNFLPNLTAAAATGSDVNASAFLQFGQQVHQLWGLLCRQISPNVFQQPERHSLLPLPNTTIVPGDRFRETYYWDSYWVIRGLLVSKMYDSATRLVLNLISLLEQMGFVPNGGRVYYLNRSQPPLLSAMVRTVYEAQPNPALLQKALPLLLAEHSYWTSPPKAVTIQAPAAAAAATAGNATAGNATEGNATTHTLSRYYATWTQPRPESYREDAALAAGVAGADSAAAAQLYRDLASGAESGWDFSSRWFADGKNLSTIRTTQIVPADLNAWLYQMERNIAWAANLTGFAATSERFNAAAADRAVAIKALLWDEAAACWRDGILTPVGNSSSSSSSLANTSSSDGSVYSLQQNPGVFASNYIPLWAGLTEGDDVTGGRIVQSLQNSTLNQISGIATTAYRTGQQWDFPNGWPPLQHMLIEGASMYGGARGDIFAGNLSRTWVTVNWRVFNSTGFMHEKYDVTAADGGIGAGGEYRPQVGFGWSNGVVLDLLATFFG